ncbi:MAG: 3-deoxy-D-manno-octulosonic-acid transferase [Candidatus Azotimanducaceae bacterium]|jgi:3-deoxy-D-manno-octulosonic-acid transferase
MRWKSSLTIGLKMAPLFFQHGFISKEVTVVAVAVGTAPLSRFLYSLFFYLVLPFVFLRLYWRSLKEPSYRVSLMQRLGFGDEIHSDRLIWVHAVSAGETIAAAPLVRRLLDQGFDVLMTNMTPTGRERAAALLGRRIENRYAPYDTPGAVTRFLNRTSPIALIIVDTELWPNMLHYAANKGVKVMLVNGRLSEKSTRGYKKISALSQPMMDALFRVAAQSEPQGNRFISLGLSREKLRITGSTKFDVERDTSAGSAIQLLASSFKSRFVFIAASTHSGEEELVLSALELLKQSIPEILLVLVPRHPHRTQELLKLCGASDFTTQKHSDGYDFNCSTMVYVLDTMGELMAFYSMSNVAFIGGSLVPVGGHNPMEPASFGLPLLMGPYLRNVDDIARQFIDEGAMKLVSSSKELAAEVSLIQSSESVIVERKNAALKVMERNKGALDRVEFMIIEALKG